VVAAEGERLGVHRIQSEGFWMAGQYDAMVVQNSLSQPDVFEYRSGAVVGERWRRNSLQ
jgi:hypothetical protein